MTARTLDHSVEGERALMSIRLESVDQVYRADVQGALVGSMLTGNDVSPAKRCLSAWSHVSVEKGELKGVSATIDDVDENRKAFEENRPVLHLPLLCVDGPMKISICHGARASTRDIGLNDLLIGGPNLTNNLAAVLLLIRQFNYAFSTDGSTVLHQVLPDERDVDTFRSLWFTDETVRDVTVRRFLSHIVGSGSGSVSGSGSASCITSFITRHLAEHIEALFPVNVYTTVRKQLYVDDAHGGGDTVDEILRLKEDLMEARALGVFTFSKWRANHPALLPREVGQTAPVVEDKLGASCSLFDPSGFFSPFILQPLGEATPGG